MTSLNKQVQALKKASHDKYKQTLLKVATTMNIMREKSLPINFESVAKLAGVSKTWIYRQPDLKIEIMNAREKNGKIQRIVDLQSTVINNKNEIIILKEKNRELKNTINKLRHQLEIVYGELYKLKHN